MTTDKTDKSLGTLFSDLTRETLDLVRQEIALGRAEMTEKISAAQTGITSIAVGGAVAAAGLLVILLGVVNLLAMYLPPEMAPWLSPLIVGVVVALIGYGMLKTGSTKLKPEKLVPHRTVDSLMRDKRVVKERVL
jgi:membrane glycosyltransferase